MKRLFAFVLLTVALFGATIVFSQDISGPFVEGTDRTFSWIPPTQLEDGRPISEDPVLLYSVYCAHLSVPYTTPAPNTSLVAPAADFPVGSYNCYATATNSTGESGPSNTRVFDVVPAPSAPGTPSNLTVQ